jgi:succinyl-diaminopimelate desuccinylase
LAELIPSAEVSLHPGSKTVMNLVARGRVARAGRRIVFNGHLDA